MKKKTVAVYVLFNRWEPKGKWGILMCGSRDQCADMRRNDSRFHKIECRTVRVEVPVPRERKR